MTNPFVDWGNLTDGLEIWAEKVTFLSARCGPADVYEKGKRIRGQHTKAEIDALLDGCPLYPHVVTIQLIGRGKDDMDSRPIASRYYWINCRVFGLEEAKAMGGYLYDNMKKNGCPYGIRSNRTGFCSISETEPVLYPMA